MNQNPSLPLITVCRLHCVGWEYEITLLNCIVQMIDVLDWVKIDRALSGRKLVNSAGNLPARRLNCQCVLTSSSKGFPHIINGDQIAHVPATGVRSQNSVAIFDLSPSRGFGRVLVQKSEIPSRSLSFQRITKLIKPCEPKASLLKNCPQFIQCHYAPQKRFQRNWI